MSTTKIYDIRVLFYYINMGVTVSPLTEINTVVVDVPIGVGTQVNSFAG